jgi:hypothetical protein
MSRSTLLKHLGGADQAADWREIHTIIRTSDKIHVGVLIDGQSNGACATTDCSWMKAVIEVSVNQESSTSSKHVQGRTMR